MQLLAPILLLFFLVSCTIYILTLLISVAYSSPFVATRKSDIVRILKLVEPHSAPSQRFIDLGAGDGSVVLIARDHFGLDATGIEVNPLLVFWARFIRRAYVHRENMFKADISKADIIYVYLFPKLLEKLSPKLIKESKPGALIISHTFKIKGLEPYLYKASTIGKHKAFYYRMHRSTP